MDTTTKGLEIFEIPLVDEMNQRFLLPVMKQCILNSNNVTESIGSELNG